MLSSNTLTLSDISALLKVFSFWKHNFETGSCEISQGLKELFKYCSISHSDTDAVEMSYLENIHHAHSKRFQVSHVEEWLDTESF
jgi:hypothetical protein